MDDLLPLVDAAGPWVLTALVLHRGTATVVALVATLSAKRYRRRSARKVLRLLRLRRQATDDNAPPAR